MRPFLPVITAVLVVVPAAAQNQPAPAPAPAAAPAPVPNDPDQRIRCRNIAITGSVARTERVCKTVAEWRRLRERANDVARDVVDHSRTRPGGT